MRLLLDTHIWIWSLLDPGRLTKKVGDALRSAGNELWLSPLSLWEFLILVERGRVVLTTRDVDAWLAEAHRQAPMIEAPLTFEVARQSRLVKVPHDDPVDRFLAATANVLDLTLVTADRRLTQARSCPILANR